MQKHKQSYCSDNCGTTWRIRKAQTAGNLQNYWYTTTHCLKTSFSEPFQKLNPWGPYQACIQDQEKNVSLFSLICFIYKYYTRYNDNYIRDHLIQITQKVIKDENKRISCNNWKKWRWRICSFCSRFTWMSYTRRYIGRYKKIY